MKSDGFGFETRLGRISPGFPTARAAKTLPRIQIENQRKVRLQPAANNFFEGVHGGAAQPSAVALISHRGVAEAVAHNPISGSERGQDHLPNVLGARSIEQGQLGPCVQSRRLAAQQNSPHTLADRRAAGLIGHADRNAAALQVTDQGAQLGTLARAVDAFQGDKFSARRQSRVCLQEIENVSGSKPASILVRPAHRRQAKTSLPWRRGERRGLGRIKILS